MVVSHVRVSHDVVVVSTVSVAGLLNEILCFFPPRGDGSSTEASSMKFSYASVLGAFFVCCCCTFSVGLAITLISLPPVPA
jgi:hypothetical protein